MSTIPKIPGPPLAGFADMFTTDDVYMGAAAAKPRAPMKPPLAAKRPAAPAKKVVPGKGQMSGLKRNETVSEHARTLKRGKVTAAKAVSAVSKAVTLLKRKPPAKPVVLGAAATAKLTPKAQAALRKQNTAATKSVKASQELAAVARTAKKTAVTLAKALQNQRKVATALRRSRGRTAVGGEDLQALLEQYYVAIGAEPDPQNPGSLTDGSMDPAEVLDVPMDDVIAESPLDYADELPPAPAMDTFIPDMDLVGGIVYDGSKGTPDGYVGSYGLMTRATDRSANVPETLGIDPIFHYGFVWGKYSADGVEKGIRWGDRFPSGTWNHIKGRWILGGFSTGYVEGGGLEQVDFAVAMKSNTFTTPTGVSYGPLIGNPNLQNFKGMRVDGKGRMFWFPQEAPDWLTFPLRQAAALAAQAEKKAALAAAKVEEAARAKEAADMAAEQARADAAALLAERQAESEAKVQATQQQTQAAQQEVQAQSELLEQAKVDRERAAAEAAQQREVDAMLLEQARRQQAYLAQHPEVEFGPPSDGGGEQEGQYPADDQQEYADEYMPEE